MFYATATTLSGYASPVLVESHLGRPTKIEGNDKHPASLGGTDIFAQASILGMYDPDRSQTITKRGDVNSWATLVREIKGPLAVQKGLGGAGIRILTQTITSPTLADQLRTLLKTYPQAKWNVYEPVNRDNVLEGAKLAFGQPVETRYDFSKAEVIVSLDADFLYAGFPGNTRYIRDFASLRNPDGNMWLERFVIVVMSLHRDFLTSSWGMYYPTRWDWMTYIGTIGMFLTAMFLFVRILPMISIFEMRTLLPEAEVKAE